jgi:hypothetical protein
MSEIQATSRPAIPNTIGDTGAQASNIQATSNSFSREPFLRRHEDALREYLQGKLTVDEYLKRAAFIDLDNTGRDTEKLEQAEATRKEIDRLGIAAIPPEMLSRLNIYIEQKLEWDTDLNPEQVEELMNLKEKIKLLLSQVDSANQGSHENDNKNSGSSAVLGEKVARNPSQSWKAATPAAINSWKSRLNEYSSGCSRILGEYLRDEISLEDFLRKILSEVLVKGENNASRQKDKDGYEGIWRNFEEQGISAIPKHVWADVGLFVKTNLALQREDSKDGKGETKLQKLEGLNKEIESLDQKALISGKTSSV